MGFSILGTGMYAPPRVVTNDELSGILDTSDAWIRQRVGVQSRHICTTETAAELGYWAALKALENSGCEVGELDLILCATVSGEDTAPAVSCAIQQKLGATCVAFDLNAACSAFLFLLETAAGFFARGVVKRVLVIGAERMSRLIDWTDRSTAVIFGDGAGAAVLGTGEGYLASTITVRGGDDIIRIPNSPGNSPFFQGISSSPYIHMKGQETFKFAVNAMCEDIPVLLEKSGRRLEDLAWIVPHQANARIIDFAAERLGLPRERFYQNIEHYGNTSAASVPIALDEINRGGLLRRGDLLLLTAFGGGLAHAACLLEW
jgi:3-oxoacyl-[acyl-carrier-protein] synthase-3